MDQTVWGSRDFARFTSYIRSSAASISSSRVTDLPGGSADTPTDKDTLVRPPGPTVVDGLGLSHPFHHALGNELGVAHQEDAELVAPETAGDVGGTDRFPDDVGRLLEQIVAHAVTQVVVHLLQPVDVDEQQADGGPGARRDEKLVLAEREEAAPVRQTRQVVDGGVSAELLLELGQMRSGPDERPGERTELVVGSIGSLEWVPALQPAGVVAHLADPSHDAGGEARHQDHRDEDRRRHREDLHDVRAMEGGVSRRDPLSCEIGGGLLHLGDELSHPVRDGLAVEEVRRETFPCLRRVDRPGPKDRAERRHPLGRELVEPIEAIPLELLGQLGVEVREVLSEGVDGNLVGRKHPVLLGEEEPTDARFGDRQVILDLGELLPHRVGAVHVGVRPRRGSLRGNRVDDGDHQHDDGDRRHGEHLRAERHVRFSCRESDFFAFRPAGTPP